MARFQRHMVLWCSLSSSSRGGSGSVPPSGSWVAENRQNRLVQADGLGEQLACTAPQPTRSQRCPGRAAAGLVVRAIVHRLLVQGYPGFLPDPVTEECGRITGAREGGRGRQ